MKVVQKLGALIACCSLWHAPCQTTTPRFVASEVSYAEQISLNDRPQGHNNLGQQVANRWIYGRSFAGVRNADGTTYLLDQLPMTYSSVARDINNFSAVVGYTNYHPNATRRGATIWIPGYNPIDMTPELEITSADAWSINDFGDVALTYDTISRKMLGGLWHGGVLYKLNDCIDTPNVDMMSAVLVNNAGIMLGKGRINGRGATMIMLTPVGEYAIPEPGSLLFLVTGLSLIGFKRIRK